MAPMRPRRPASRHRIDASAQKGASARDRCRVSATIRQIAFASLIPIAVTGPADSADLGLERYAVSIARDDAESGSHKITGSGIYFGAGLILTAAHVVPGPPSQGVAVMVGERAVKARTMVKGAYSDVDVTLLSVEPGALPDELRRLASLHLCVEEPIPGQTVTVVAPGNIRDSVIVPSSILAPQLAAKLPTLIRDVYTTGNSGAGVFDAELGCLMGIISRKIERPYWRDVDGVPTEMRAGLAKYFTSATLIRAFLGKDLNGH